MTKEKREKPVAAVAAAGLSFLFSDESKAKFARELKPEEFQKKKRERVEEDPNPNPVSEEKEEKQKKSSDNASMEAKLVQAGGAAGLCLEDKKKFDKLDEVERRRMLRNMEKKAKRRTNREAKKVAKQVTSVGVSAEVPVTPPAPASLPAASHAAKAMDKKRKAEAAAEERGEDSDEGSEHEEVPEEPTASRDGSAASNANDSRTLFMGNIPISETVKSIGAFCAKFGEVHSVRLRSVPVEGTAVDDKGNQDLVKKVCTNAGKFGTQKKCFNAYVVFKEEASVAKALTANNSLMGKRHLRVDKANPTLFDTRRSVFIGGLPHYMDEEALREHFAKVLPGGHADIEGVRIVRDPETLLCKGFGYMLFRDRDHVLKVLPLHQQKFKSRELRVQTCGKRTKKGSGGETAKKPRHSLDGKKGGGSADSSTSNNAPSSASTSTSGKAKAALDPSAEAKNALFALKRMNLKKSGRATTRNKALVDKSQKKAVKGRYGKRLGGNVKKAMKADKNKNKMI